MLYGKNESGQLIEATKGAKASCPSCGGILRPKCGPIVIHHWAHIGNDCDSWSEPESEWHKEWKEHFPPHCREVVMGKKNEHRADVRLDHGLVIELQHSSIRPATIAKRERFYGSMIWLFDARDFVENFEFKTASGLRLPIHSFLNSKYVDTKARSVKEQLIEYQTKLVECTAALERVEDRLMNLPAKLLSSHEDSGAYELIDSFGGERPGLVALTKSAQQNKKEILDVLRQLPDKRNKENVFFGLDPHLALKYLATGVPNREKGERQYEWQERVLPSAKRERRIAIGKVAWFIHRHIRANGPQHTNQPLKSQVIESAIDHIGYFVAAAKLKADIEWAKFQTKPGTNFQEVNLRLIKVPPFQSGLFSAKALNMAFTWKYRRKSLFFCDRPQVWDFGEDHLLFFENLSRQSDGSNVGSCLFSEQA